jgi:23S rRNA pseudouridine2605 synthase
MLNKPAGCVSTRSDPQRRPTILDLLPQEFRHLHPVGRLDADTEGLLLLTNDGTFTHRLTHPRHGITKTYRAFVKGAVTPMSLVRLRRGLLLDDGPTAPCRARIIAQSAKSSEVELELHEGRKRQVRRMLAGIGHPVLALRRTRVGGVALGNLPRGAFRRLTPPELTRLRG